MTLRAPTAVIAATLALVSATGCSATSGGGVEHDGVAGSGGGGGSSPVATGGQSGVVIGGDGGTPSRGAPVTEIVCPTVAQDILVLDFRSGWWTGGGGGDFANTVLAAMVQPCANLRVEYHHFEVDVRFKCVAGSTVAPSCQELGGETSDASPQDVFGWFDNGTWNDYTQVWVLSGSELDMADVALSGSLFQHFLEETRGSCTPVFVGAGDGFIDHGNSVTTELGLGNVFSTDLQFPGFFSVAMGNVATQVAIDGRMQQGAQFDGHLLFTGVGSMADAVSTGFQSAHGDLLKHSSPHYDVIADDTAGRPAIAIGLLALAGGDDRPVILDAGMQRYYAAGHDAETRRFLQNLVMYLGLVGCKADTPR